MFVSVPTVRLSGSGDGSVDGQWRRATTVQTGTVFVVVDGSLVRERRDCLVQAIAWFEASVVGQQGQSTTILHITLEVANSKAKSEGIQIYCYM